MDVERRTEPNGIRVVQVGRFGVSFVPDASRHSIREGFKLLRKALARG
jgi:hypothetical protein